MVRYMTKGYSLDNDTSLYKRLYIDFNLYGANLNVYEKEEDDLNKYGKVK